MDIPGASGAVDPEAFAHAQEEQERLLENLKKEVQADFKDIGVLRKEMTVTVPQQIIADHMEHNYDELMSDALVPGFRKGRAPRRLIEKRFGSEVRESLISSILGQSYFAAIENNELDVLGDPLFRMAEDDNVKLVGFDEALHHFELPEQGEFTFTCEIELKPTFELPELTGIEIEAPELEITKEMVDEQMLQRRKIRGRYEPVSDAGATRDDQLIADAVLTSDDTEVKREENVTLGVRPTRLDGIALMKLDEVLEGVKVGEVRKTECTIPDDYERADLRGKPGEFAFHVHEIKRLVPEPMETFLQSWGFENEDEAREHFREELNAEREQLVDREKKAQIEQFLLDHTTLDLPADFSARQTDRAVMRRVIELEQRGVPLSDVETHIDELRTSATEQVARELRLGFILEKVAEKLEISITDEEVNTAIARMAQMYGRRFDRVRDDLQNRGLLGQLVEQLRQDKCIAQLLDDAKITAAAADKTQKKSATKKTSKKKTGGKQKED